MFIHLYLHVMCRVYDEIFIFTITLWIRLYFKSLTFIVTQIEKNSQPTYLHPYLIPNFFKAYIILLD
jgi:hypothetical protein